MSAKDHPHRILEYARTSRSSCSGKCKKLIHEGRLRYGTQVVVNGHRSVTWRCMACITKKQADNLANDAHESGLTEREFLTVPPPPETGGDGAEPEVFEIFLKYLDAIKREDIKEKNELLRALNNEKGSNPESDPDKCEKEALKTDCHILDAQLKNDIDMIKLLTHDDLKAICFHHRLEHEGTTPDLQRVLHEYYATAPILIHSHHEHDRSHGAHHDQAKRDTHPEYKAEEKPKRQKK